LKQSWNPLLGRTPAPAISQKSQLRVRRIRICGLEAKNQEGSALKIAARGTLLCCRLPENIDRREKTSAACRFGRQRSSARRIAVELSHEIHTAYDVVECETDSMHRSKVTCNHGREELFCLIDLIGQVQPYVETRIRAVHRLIE
jgi:hypothetical protein